MPSRSSGSVRIFSPRWTKAALVRRLRERLQRLAAEVPLVRVVLFGSYATGRFTAASDIDLLVVYDGAPRHDAYELIRRTLDVPGLEPHVYTCEEAQSIRATIERMERDGVVLLSR